jgi:hypothetical protein
VDAAVVQLQVIGVSVLVSVSVLVT